MTSKQFPHKPEVITYLEMYSWCPGYSLGHVEVAHVFFITFLFDSRSSFVFSLGQRRVEWISGLWIDRGRL